MKKIHILIGALGFALFAQGCVQTVSSSATSCPIIADGTLRELPAACYSATVTATNDFSINLETVAVADGQTLELIAKATDVSESSGWKLAFTGGASGKVRVSKLGTGQAMDSLTLNTSDGKNWCFDIHAIPAEDPHHIIFWRGNCPTTQLGTYGGAAFNSNSEAAGTGHDARSSSNYGTGMNGTLFPAGSQPTGTKVLYKADKGTVASITVATAKTTGL